MARKSWDERKKMVIEVLNKARAMELHGIHQYMNQHYNLDNMDYGELTAKRKLIAIDEMRHGDTEGIDQTGNQLTPPHSDPVDYWAFHGHGQFGASLFQPGLSDH